MNLSNELLEYLKLKLTNFQKTTKKGQYLFTCPNIEQHKYKGKDPTATFIPGSDKINCLQCGWKGTAFDAIRVVERNRDLTDAEILESLSNNSKTELFPELDGYKKLNWSLVPIAKNGKNPIESEWTSKTHYDKSEWIKWINSGFNLGCQTGQVSGITVIDVDLKIAPTLALEEIYKELTAMKTLESNTPHGRHFIVKYDKDIKTGTQLGGLPIDIRNDGAQILIPPSKINNSSYCWRDLETEIKTIPESLKNKLLEFNKNNRTKTPEVSQQTIKTMESPIELTNSNLEGCCNDTFVQFGGALLKIGIPTDKVKIILYYLNKNWLKNPMPTSSVDNMVGSLEGYKSTEEETQEDIIYEYIKLIKIDVHPKDVMEHTGLKRNIVDKYLSELVKEGKAIRLARGRYQFKQKVEWVNDIDNGSDFYNYKIPYFNDIAYFQNGDIVLLGGKSGTGKTHIAMNIVKQIREQGVIPFYISLETGSRYKKIAEKLNLKQQDFYVSKEPIDNPLQIEIEPNSFTIIDWLYTGEDFAATQSIFKHISDEMRRKGGILIVFTQLKDNYDYFAVNLIKSFPSLAARYIYDDETGLTGHWQVDKIRDAKGHYQTTIIPCEFNFDSKELRKKDNI